MSKDNTCVKPLFSIFPVKSLAKAVLGRHRSRRPAYMAVLSAYLDASGSESDPRISFLTVAGYVGTEDQWTSFEKEWQKVLKEEDLSYLHMKHFAHSRGEFKSWKNNEARRKRFMARLTKIIVDHDLEDFSVSMEMASYRRVDKTFKVTETLGAYGMAALSAMGKIEKWHKRYRSEDSLLFLLEKGDAGQEMLKISPRVLGIPNLCNASDPIFINKKWKENGSDRYCIPMQASDLLAYEHQKYLTDLFIRGENRVRESFFQIAHPTMTAPLAPTWTVLDGRFAQMFCQIFKIPKRG